jgi:hypothetical protein
VQPHHLVVGGAVYHPGIRLVPIPDTGLGVDVVLFERVGRRYIGELSVQYRIGLCSQEMIV